MIAERTLAQAAHAWGAQGIPFNDQPKAELLHRRITAESAERGMLNE
jgi:hypothetical protein